MRNYYLIGPSGAGKSFLGPKVAQALGLTFLDSDKAIEVQTGLRTDQLLDQRGEAHLRACEANFLASHPVSGHLVACGAGMILLPDFLELLPQVRVIAFLEANIDTLVSRISRQTDQRRSLLEGPPGLRVRLEVLLSQREAIYSRAWPLRLRTDAFSVDVLVEKLCQHYQSCQKEH